MFSPYPTSSTSSLPSFPPLLSSSINLFSFLHSLLLTLLTFPSFQRFPLSLPSFLFYFPFPTPFFTFPPLLLYPFPFLTLLLFLLTLLTLLTPPLLLILSLGMRAEYLTKDLISLSPDTLVVVDSVDPRVMHILDSNSGKETNKITHTVEVTWYVPPVHAWPSPSYFMSF